MKILILAAGYGTRLYPHIRKTPKPLLKLKKRPVIDYLLDKIEELDNVSDIIVVTNNRFFKQFKAWANSHKIKYPIRIINDLTASPEDRLGAIGDMYFVFGQEGLTDDFLVLGGDNFFEGSLLDFIHFAKGKYPFASIGLFDIKDKEQARHYGVARLDQGSRLVEFCEKPARPKSSLVAMCLYYFPQAKLRLIEDYFARPHNSFDTLGSYINWLSKKESVYGYKFSDLWFDIGHIHTYNKIKRILRTKE
ncbi:MAG: nucleotidyltransferase family protein [Candidatus Omnitrophica bacterium]|nr:nucleotidyltransferase family protein [Candidatus Omnitrophota bacterium]